MRKELYNMLRERLKEVDGGAVRHIDLWNHNVEFIEQEDGWERPAVFVEFCPIRWNAIVSGVEYRAEPVVRQTPAPSARKHYRCSTCWTRFMKHSRAWRVRRLPVLTWWRARQTTTMRISWRVSRFTSVWHSDGCRIDIVMRTAGRIAPGRFFIVLLCVCWQYPRISVEARTRRNSFHFLRLPLPWCRFP